MQIPKQYVSKEEIISKFKCDAYSADALNGVSNAADFAYRFLLCPLRFINEGVEVCGTDITLTGRTAAVHLDGCTHCFVLVGTLGEGVDRLINRLSVSDMSGAYTADCAANILIEKYLDALTVCLKESLKEGESVSNRFSAGYGDLPLELQPKILKALGAEKIGVTVSGELLMHPLKTVTAFIGVGKGAKFTEYRCADCSRYPDCDKRTCYDKL